jgi:hypothetical protein
MFLHGYTPQCRILDHILLQDLEQHQYQVSHSKRHASNGKLAYIGQFLVLVINKILNKLFYTENNSHLHDGREMTEM